MSEEKKTDEIVDAHLTRSQLLAQLEVGDVMIHQRKLGKIRIPALDSVVEMLMHRRIIIVAGE